MSRKILTPQDADSLGQIAERLTVAAGRLRQSVEKMADRHVTHLMVRDHSSLMKGMIQVEKFASNAEEAFYAVLAERGEYVAGNSDGHANRKREKK